MKRKIITFIVLFISFTGCIQNQNIENTRIDNKGSVTLGDVQRDIKIGTRKSQVATYIGSPNIVSTEKNKEVWIYDKISTENSETEANLTAGGAGPIGAGIGFGAFSGGIKNSVTSNKTLTVIIIFNSNSEVEKIDYHTSRY